MSADAAMDRRGHLGATVAGLLLLGLAIAAPGAAWAGASRNSPSGLGLPRFVSLGAERMNVRTGPGVRYPVAWVFLRRGTPLEVIAEFELWRKVRDIDGAEGWAHRSLLSERRTALVIGEIRTLSRQPDENAAPVLRAEPGVHGRLLTCRVEWCKMRINGLEGWLPRHHIWGVHPGEFLE